MNSTSDHINMADHDNSPPGPPDTTTTRVRLAIAVLVTYVCLFNGLTAFGLVGPDEPRYAAIARDMAVSDDWVTPRLHGEPWLEKPILYYWVATVGTGTGSGSGCSQIFQIKSD